MFLSCLDHVHWHRAAQCDATRVSANSSSLRQPRLTERSICSNSISCSVGVGVVVLRNFAPAATAEVLLIRRAKQPSRGLLCFPGGRLEWGETLAACAAREVREETGVAIKSAPQVSRFDALLSFVFLVCVAIMS